MHADLSRWNFRPDQHYSRVIVQQGRVSLDADANAQASILLHYLRTLAADLIGEFGGPGDGFKITTNPDQNEKISTFGITPGRYYVDGLLCEANPDNGTADANGNVTIDYFSQPDGYGLFPPPLLATPFLVWLKVWERFVSAVEDPNLREIALGLNGPDTTGRTRVVWQVLASPWPAGVEVPIDSQGFYNDGGSWDNVKQQLFGDPPAPYLLDPSGRLMAQAAQPQQSTNACTLSPSSGYRGPENQLYRVEIHRGGVAVAGAKPDSGGPTFKWSRDNGSVILPITDISGAVVSVATLGRDPKLSVDVGNFVEIVDDAYASQGQPGPIPKYDEPLHKVTAVDPVLLKVTIDPVPASNVGADPSLHPYLRRWDQDEVLVSKAGLTIDSKDRAIEIVTTDGGSWIDLEDGVQVQFSAGSYREGDYWLIPARVVTGDVEWPADAAGLPLPLPPEGVRYHVAPLAVISDPTSPVDLRATFLPVTGLGTAVNEPPQEPPEEPSPAPAPPSAAKAQRATRKSN